MQRIKYGWNIHSSARVNCTGAVALCALCFALLAGAQRPEQQAVQPGEIVIRTTEAISSAAADSRPFMGIVQQDVLVQQMETTDGQTYGLGGEPSLAIGSDHNIRWHAPVDAQVLVQIDSQPLKLFAQGPSGNEPADWMQPGHVYTFMLRDLNGRELARDQLDLR